MKIICIWPDETWCLLEDIEMYGWKSDDYAEVSIPIELTPEEVEDFVINFNSGGSPLRGIAP